ncbi:hypothetical protein LBMAG41_26660 [Cyanobium sp.]|nr:hypothetical protein LBMAG41_26660 [Cyanobium sp.]
MQGFSGEDGEGVEQGIPQRIFLQQARDHSSLKTAGGDASGKGHQPGPCWRGGSIGLLRRHNRAERPAQWEGQRVLTDHADVVRCPKGMLSQPLPARQGWDRCRSWPGWVWRAGVGRCPARRE